jgi:Short C-terminal domain
VNLKEKLAAAREREREHRDAEKTRLRRYRKALELQKLGIVAIARTGMPDASVPEDELDRMLADEMKRQAQVYQAIANCEKVTHFLALGVQIITGDVYSIGDYNHSGRTNSSRLLGPLAEAKAEMTDSTAAFSLGKAMVMPLATAPLARKETADALIIFRDGTIHRAPLDGSFVLRDARRQCIEFNAVAAACAPALSDPDAGSEPAARLRKLQHLLTAGLLSQEEYEAKRAAIIETI